jgi:protein ImuB
MTIAVVKIAFDQKEDPETIRQCFLALQNISPKISIVEFGIFAIPSHFATRYFGGEKNLKKAIVKALKPLGKTIKVGIANNLFLAKIAADKSLIIDNRNRDMFLESLDISYLRDTKIIDFLSTIGVGTLKDFVSLGKNAIGERLGEIGLHYYLQITTEDDNLNWEPNNVHMIETHFEPPISDIESLIFYTKTLARELLDPLKESDIFTDEIEISLTSQDESCFIKKLYSSIPFNDVVIADRLRWHLASLKIKSPVIKLQLATFFLNQPGYWQNSFFTDKNDLKIEQTLCKLSGLCQIQIARRSSGRHPLEMQKTFYWQKLGTFIDSDTNLCWSGQIPRPVPSIVYKKPVKVGLFDSTNRKIILGANGELSSDPFILKTYQKTLRIKAWSYPWPVEEYWWDTNKYRRRGFLQVLAKDNSAYLLSVEHSQWHIDAVYD